MPSSCKEIGEEAFDGVTSEYEVELEEGITELGAHAFRYAKITKLTLPSSLEEINYECFINFSGEIYYNDSMEHWREIYPTSDHDISSDVKIHCNNGTINE